MVIDLGNINSLLAASFAKDSSLGLASGKMGGCIYFYCLSRAQNNPQYRKTAEKLLDDVFAGIASVRSVDVKNGLGGIALGIHFLTENQYVKGDPNAIIKDIDDMIYRKLSYPRYYQSYDCLSFMQSLLYLSFKLQQQNPSSEQYFLTRELAIETTDRLYTRIDDDYFKSPLVFDMEYKLPLLISTLNQIHSLHIYDLRIEKILEEISPQILSTLPVLNANRLYLWWAMQKTVSQLNMPGWEKHVKLLQKETDIEQAIDRELNSADIFFNGGHAGLLFLLEGLKEHFNKEYFKGLKTKVSRKIEDAPTWENLSNPEFLEMHTGIYNGFCGAVMALLYAQK